MLPCFGECLAFLFNLRLPKSISFIKETESKITTLHAGALYYLLIGKARAIHMRVHTLAAREWIIMIAICTLVELSAPRPLRGAAQALSR